MDRRMIIVLGVLNLIIWVHVASAKTITLIEPNKPLPRVLAAEGKVHLSAAVDLCDYLSRVTSQSIAIDQGAPDTKIAEVQVTIHVGPDDFVLEHAPEVNKLYADGFILKYIHHDGRHHLILAGIRGQSSRWAVEEFLKQYAGVRWLFPYPQYGEIVPLRKTISIESELNRTFNPDYISRANVQMYYFDSTNKYLRLKAYGYPFGTHVLHTIFDAEDYKDHPEWFAYYSAPHYDLIRFKSELVGTTTPRRWRWDYGNGWQICTSNSQTVDHAVAYARDYLDKHPDSPIVSLGANDGGGWCEDDLCKSFAKSFNPAYTISERWWHWVNQVAKEVAKTHPDRWVEALAYSATSVPPRFKLENNVAISLTTVVPSQLAVAEQWKSKCKSVNLYSYAYGNSFMGFRHYPHAMRDYLKWGHDTLGAMSHITECGGDWSFDAPKYHYIQALQWDVNADPDQIMEDYCQSWFGAAAKPMKQFWDHLEQVYERQGHPQRLIFYGRVAWRKDHNEFDHYTLKDIELLDQYITQAQEQVDSEADRFRLARVTDAWEWYQTILLSKLKYGDRQRQIRKATRYSLPEALKTAREIAELISRRQYYFDQLRTYPEINHRMALVYFWSFMSEVSVFSDERTLLDALCDQITQQQKQTQDPQSTSVFWQQVKQDDPLFEAAQTQIYMITHPSRDNVLVNGNFESGHLDEWKVQGGQVDIKQSTSNQRSKFTVQMHRGAIATISQSVAVKPGQRYRLTASVRSVTKPPKPKPPEQVIAFDAVIRFYQADKEIYCEPTRSILTTSLTSARWGKLSATVTVPPAADTARITLRNNARCKTLVDNVVFELIKEGPKVVLGILTDNFSQPYLDRDKWFKSTAQRSGQTPKIEDGHLILEDNPMATLVGFGDFNDLLRYEDDQRYRLRIHLARGDVHDRPAFMECGIQTGTGPISTRSSGIYWTCQLSQPREKPDQLFAYAFENNKQRSSATYYNIASPESKRHDIWLTFYFDPDSIWVYVGREGYDESDNALVGQFNHKISDLADNGSVYFKFTGRNVKIDAIDLMHQESTAINEEIYEPLADPLHQ